MYCDDWVTTARCCSAAIADLESIQLSREVAASGAHLLSGFLVIEDVEPIGRTWRKEGWGMEVEDRA